MEKPEDAPCSMFMDVQKRGFALTGKGGMTMTDRDRVIKGLEETEIRLTHAVDRGGEMSEIGAFKCLNHVKCALSLLKEQEAKPVIVTTNAYGTRFFHCPKCNRDLYVYPRQLYCSNCGQAVKWNA